MELTTNGSSRGAPPVLAVKSGRPEAPLHPLVCGTTSFSQADRVQIKTNHTTLHSLVVIGDGLEIGTTPELGKGQLGLFATRDLERGTCTYFDGMLFAKQGNTIDTVGLQKALRTHACCIQRNGRYLLLGVRAHTFASLGDVNRAATSMGGASFANSSDNYHDSNARRSQGEKQTFTECTRQTGGGLYQSACRCSNRIIDDLVVIVMSRHILKGEEIVWSYTPECLDVDQVQPKTRPPCVIPPTNHERHKRKKASAKTSRRKAQRQR